MTCRLRADTVAPSSTRVHRSARTDPGKARRRQTPGGGMCPGPIDGQLAVAVFINMQPSYKFLLPFWISALIVANSV